MDPLREIQDKNMIFKLDKIVCQNTIQNKNSEERNYLFNISSKVN